jgi:hypothetical protein
MKNKQKKGQKGFFSRWKEGVNQITPYQQSRIILLGQSITMVGIICGIITSFLAYPKFWLIAILAGALFVQGMSLLAEWQKYQIYKTIEKGNNMTVNSMGGYIQ